jgi:peptidoglycan L-alanyl-D-glutamate endopeptidase CwlK
MTLRTATAPAGAALLIVGFISSVVPAGGEPPGTVGDPVVDSAMTEKEVFDGLDPNCPGEIRQVQRIVDVLYYSFDGKVHKGQLVVHEELVEDVRHALAVALREKFPIKSVIPASHPRFRKDGRWDDDRSMDANNTSAFNYRAVTGGKRLSNHASGRAIDVNPVQNPYVKGELVLPKGAKYDPSAAGALTADHPVTKAFVGRGWEWGGTWKALKDYQHFEKAAGTK